MARQSGRSEQVRRGWWGGGVCLLALALAGCSGGAGSGPAGGSRAPDDPLLPRVKPGPEKGASAAANTGTLSPLPVLPAPSGSTSPAALATGTNSQLDGRGDLRGGNGGALLGKPVPALPAPGGSPPGAVVPVGGGPVQTIDQGLKLLEMRGVKNFRLELQRETGQWRCACSVPGRQNPAIKQVYDTTAADPLTALRAVVEKMEREQQ